MAVLEVDSAVRDHVPLRNWAGIRRAPSVVGRLRVVTFPTTPRRMHWRSTVHLVCGRASPSRPDMRLEPLLAGHTPGAWRPASSHCGTNPSSVCSHCRRFVCAISNRCVRHVAYGRRRSRHDGCCCTRGRAEMIQVTRSGHHNRHASRGSWYRVVQWMFQRGTQVSWHAGHQPPASRTLVWLGARSRSLFICVRQYLTSPAGPGLSTRGRGICAVHPTFARRVTVTYPRRRNSCVLSALTSFLATLAHVGPGCG